MVLHSLQHVTTQAHCKTQRSQLLLSMTKQALQTITWLHCHLEPAMWPLPAIGAHTFAIQASTATLPLRKPVARKQALLLHSAEQHKKPASGLCAATAGQGRCAATLAAAPIMRLHF
jgi:hypothetical protein